MKTTLPPSRDLPPHAHARIRARLEREVGGRRRPAWLLPLVAGMAAAILVAFVAWPQATDSGSPPARPAPTPTGERPQPGPPGVTPQRRAQVEADCRRHAGASDLLLYQLIDDAAGRFALLYSPAGRAYACHPGRTPLYADDGQFPDVRPLDWLPGPLSVDIVTGNPAGGPLAAEAPDPSLVAVSLAAGRVSADVARVTYTYGGRTAEAEPTNGTYVARILYPPNFTPPVMSPPLGVVRAYDAAGDELAAVRLSLYHHVCYAVPGGGDVPHGNAVDPPHCQGVAVPWR
jgi:hypothetical protein